MYWLHISSPVGVEAEFSVDSLALAVDLALRSERAGLAWRAETRDDGRVEPLSLRGLRALAASSDHDESERQLLDHVEWQHELQSWFRMN